MGARSGAHDLPGVIGPGGWRSAVSGPHSAFQVSLHPLIGPKSTARDVYVTERFAWRVSTLVGGPEGFRTGPHTLRTSTGSSYPAVFWCLATAT